MTASDEWMTALNVISHFAESYHVDSALQARAQPL